MPKSGHFGLLFTGHVTINEVKTSVFNRTFHFRYKKRHNIVRRSHTTKALTSCLLTCWRSSNNTWLGHKPHCVWILVKVITVFIPYIMRYVWGAGQRWCSLGASPGSCQSFSFSYICWNLGRDQLKCLFCGIYTISGVQFGRNVWLVYLPHNC